MVEVSLGEGGHVGAFGEVLAEEPVGVLVGSSLPRGFGVTEVDLDTGVDGELGVSCHLFALIPRQRLPQMLGELLDRR